MRITKKSASGIMVASGVTGAFNGILVILKDEWAGLKKLMTSITGHHWTSHGLILLVLWAVLSIILSSLRKEIELRKAWLWLLWGNMIGLILIIGYYLIVL